MSDYTENRLNTVIFYIAVVVLIAASYLWRWQAISAFHFDYDEGIHLIVAKLWSAGHEPYSEIFVSYPPIFLWSFGWAWELFQMPDALQLLMVTYTLLGVLAVIYLGTIYHSRLAGLAAGAILSFSPPYFITSLLVMTETPSISIAVVAVALAETYRRQGGWGWAFLAGCVLAFGLSLKILPVYAIPLVGLMIIGRHIALNRWGRWNDIVESWHSSKNMLIRDVALLAGGFLLTFFLPILFFNLPAFYDQVVGMRLVSREVQYNFFTANNQFIIDFLFSNTGLMALALYGLAFVVVKRLSDYGWLIIWFALIWASMYLHTPLREKHLPIFLPILAIFAGFAVQHMVNVLKKRRTQAMSLNSASTMLAMALVVGLFIWDAPQIVAQNNGAHASSPITDSRQRGINFIKQISTPHDCVIADNPVFLHETDRLPPPQLAETSQTRIDTGFLTLASLTDIIDANACHVVSVVSPRFAKSMPGLIPWLETRYVGLWQDGETAVYFARIDTAASDNLTLHNSNIFSAPETSTPVLQSITPASIELPRSRGSGRHLSIIWQLAAPFEPSYQQTLTLLNTDGEIVHQVSRRLFEGHITPETWQVGQQARDTFWFNLPNNIPAGTYNLTLSLCSSGNSDCLVIDGNMAQTALLLGQVTVE